MFKTMKKRIKNEKGLTLIELLAVIVILAIVAAIAIPAIGNIIDNSRFNAVKSDAINVLNAAQLYYTENPNGVVTTGTGAIDTSTQVTAAQLESAGFLEAAGSMAGATVSNANPLTIAGTSSTKVNNHSVVFSGATIQEINAYTTKGSAYTGGTIQ